MKKLKIAQIGVHHEHASGKMATLRREFADQVEILGIAPESPTGLYPDFRNDVNYHGLKWMSVEEILNLPDLDAVFVETDMRMLVPTARRALAHNLPIHIDKPAGGEELDAFAELMHEAERKHLPVQPAYMFRGSHPINFARRAVRKGWLGKVSVFDANMNRCDIAASPLRSWQATYPGGGMFNYGSHLIDVVIDFFGEPEEVIPVSRKMGDDELNDNMLAVLAYPGCLATVRVSLRVCRPAAHRRISIHGERGLLEITPIEQGYDRTPGYPTFNSTPVTIHMELEDGNDEYSAGTYDLQFDPMRDRYFDQLREFFAILRGEKDNPYSAEHEILVQKAVLAASGYIPWKYRIKSNNTERDKK